MYTEITGVAAMYVLAMQIDLHIGHARSLKDKRGVLRSILDGFPLL